MPSALTQNWDYIAFFVGVLLVSLALEIWLRGSRYRASLSWPVWIVLLVILVSGWVPVHSVTQRERDRIRAVILGFAPTYALVMQHLEHDKVTLQSPPDDPTYLDLIDAQRRLLAVNPTINDVYTMRKLPTGETVFLADSETDYDRNGIIEGERESRTAIGEVYPIQEPELDLAFAGHPGFASEPVQDRWGTWISAFYPIRTDAGELDGVLGIDLDAATWFSAIRRVRLGGIGLVGMVAAMVLGAATIIALLRSHIATQALAQDELATARDAAIAASRQKADFLANMSHEIRTPMNGILGVTGLLLGTELTAQQRADAVTIRTSADSLLSILNDILDFSKVEAGKLTFEFVDFDVREAVEGVLDLLGERAAAKHLEIFSSIDAAVPRTLRGDPGRIRQVLLNLLGNALKFTDSGEVVLRVSTVREATEGTVLRFEVADTGIGLSPEQQNQVFDAFVQGDSSTARKFGGTGLGLAISKQLVENMGGEMGVTSEPGKGATFWFTCQLERPFTKADDSGSTAELGSLRILVVDDNATNRQILTRQLANWGINAAPPTAGGELALQSLRTSASAGQPFDIAILDMQMPGMDGLTLARLIKADPALASTRLIMLTSMGQHLLEAEAKEIGLEAVLIKPVKEARLLAALRAAAGLAVEADSAVVIDAPPSQAASSRLQNVRVLIADDNSVNRMVAIRQLRQLGCQAAAVANGHEAIREAGRIAYDIVLMDCQMPEMDGFEATRRLRELGFSKPIIALTADAMKGARERCLEAGMSDYLCKPVRLTELEALLERAVPPEERTPPQSDATLTAPPMTPEALEFLKDASGDDAAFAAELTAVFFREITDLITEIYQAISTDNTVQLRRSVHRMKGSCAAFGAAALMQTCSRLESRLCTGEGPELGTLARELRVERQRLLDMLEPQSNVSAFA